MPRREIPTPFHPITASFQAALQACDKRNLRLQEPFSCSYVAIQQKCPKTIGFCCLQSSKYTMFKTDCTSLLCLVCFMSIYWIQLALHEYLLLLQILLRYRAAVFMLIPLQTSADYSYS